MLSCQTLIKFKHRNTVRPLCWNTDFLWSTFSRIWSESHPYFFVFGQNQRTCLNTGKYGYDSVHIWEITDQRKPVLWHFFTQWSPHEGVLIFSKVVDWRHVTLLYINIFLMISTTAAQQPYFIAPMTRKYIFKITSRHLLTMQSNHPMNIVFLQERHCFSRKHTGISGA